MGVNVALVQVCLPKAVLPRPPVVCSVGSPRSIAAHVAGPGQKPQPLPNLGALLLSQDICSSFFVLFRKKRELTSEKRRAGEIWKGGKRRRG